MNKKLPKYDGPRTTSSYKRGTDGGVEIRVLENGDVEFTVWRDGKAHTGTWPHDKSEKHPSAHWAMITLAPDGFWNKAMDLLRRLKDLEESQKEMYTAREDYNKTHSGLMYEAGRLGVAMGVWKEEPFPRPQYAIEMEALGAYYSSKFNKDKITAGLRDAKRRDAEFSKRLREGMKLRRKVQNENVV